MTGDTNSFAEFGETRLRTGFHSGEICGVFNDHIGMGYRNSDYRIVRLERSGCLCKRAFPNQLPTRSSMDPSRIRSIIAHINHGKPTLADRSIGTRVRFRRDMENQVLDNMDLKNEASLLIPCRPI